MCRIYRQGDKNFNAHTYLSGTDAVLDEVRKARITLPTKNIQIWGSYHRYEKGKGDRSKGEEMHDDPGREVDVGLDDADEASEFETHRWRTFMGRLRI